MPNCFLVTGGTGVCIQLSQSLQYTQIDIVIGPTLMAVGPWKPVKLHCYVTKISELDIRSQVSEALAVNVTVDVLFSGNSPVLASVVLRDPHGVKIVDEPKIKVESGYSRVEFGFAPGNLELWYPVGYGKQPLYTVEVEVTNEVRILHSRWQRLTN